VAHARWYLFSFCVLSVGAGLLQRRSGNSFGTYSLSRIYQLRENITVMKMILKMAVPVFTFTTPAMGFYLLFIILKMTSEYQFTRNFSIAMFDWWIAVLSLTVSLTFPIFDIRFRRVAVKIPIFRLLFSNKNTNSAKVFATKHVTNNMNAVTDVYFNILAKEWNEPRN
ncbi:hypothetical protein PENTCL1PPCAC_17204, partial [Pristionchus entomophagus]